MPQPSTQYGEKALNEYKLTFTMTIKAQDDPAARQQAKNIAEAIVKVAPESEMKLQQVHTDQPPRGVRID